MIIKTVDELFQALLAYEGDVVLETPVKIVEQRFPESGSVHTIELKPFERVASALVRNPEKRGPRR